MNAGAGKPTHSQRLRELVQTHPCAVQQHLHTPQSPGSIVPDSLCQVLLLTNLPKLNPNSVLLNSK